MGVLCVQACVWVILSVTASCALTLMKLHSRITLRKESDADVVDTATLISKPKC